MRTARIIATVATVLALLSGSAAFGALATSPYTWNASTPGYNAAATLHLLAVDTTGLTFADFIQRGNGSTLAGGFGDSGVSVGWDDTWVGGVGGANTNGDALDGLWVQIFNDGGWWDMGTPTRYVTVFTSQDHGPYLGEGLEYRVFGANALGGPLATPQILVSNVFLDGWRPHNPAEDSNGNLWLSDDIAGTYDLGGYYQYVYLKSWDVYGSYNEPEIDAVAGSATPPPPIPEPSTFAVWSLLGGLGIAVGRRWRKRRAL